MTSLAFVAGVMPLAVSSGAGAASQNDIGTGVVGGMISGTALAIFFVLLLYEIVRDGWLGSGGCVAGNSPVPEAKPGTGEGKIRRPIGPRSNGILRSGS